MATHVSFDGDYIYVGDAYKNIGVLWLCDKEELKKEKAEDTPNILKLKYLFSNTLDTRVVGVYSLRAEDKPNHLYRLSAVEKQLLTLLTASEEGYLRLF